MKIPGYHLDFTEAIATVKQKEYKTIVLQVPEGLKMQASVFTDLLKEKTQATVIISSDPCFGACDVANYDFYNHNIDLIIQVGHTPIPNIERYSIPTIFVNARADVDVSKGVKKALKYLKGKKVGLISTAQHIHTLNNVKELLMSNNIESFIAKGNDRINLPGQVLGCNFSAALAIIDKVDLFLYIGSGTFHPLGLLITSKKPVVAIDPYTTQVKEKELDELKDLILKQRYGAIARSMHSQIFGILIGTKRGQQRLNLAFKIQDMLTTHKKKTYLIGVNNVSPSFLEGFKFIDCFVSTTCPRIAIDDYMQYKIPIITPVEVEILLGLRKWIDYQFDQIDSSYHF
jgi:2-(3-amino-3-carboxypropyl)histidine synthase